MTMAAGNNSTHRYLFSRLIGLSVCLALGLSHSARGEDSASIEAFLGRYDGQAEFIENGIRKKRNLGVEISRSEKGFVVKWQSTTIKSSGKTKTKEYEIEFIPTERPHVFQAAQKPNLFGGFKPLDPMKGEPYVWARIIDKTLTVNALLVNDDGGYELQIYDRTIAQDGLQLIMYNRIRNGEPLRTISTLLQKR